MPWIPFSYTFGIWRKPNRCQRRKERTCLAFRPWLIAGQLNLNLFGAFISELSRVCKKLSSTIIATCTYSLRHYKMWVWLSFLCGTLWWWFRWAGSWWFHVDCDHNPVCHGVSIICILALFLLCYHFFRWMMWKQRFRYQCWNYPSF